MPYKIVKSDEGKFCVHKIDAAGEITGKPAGCHSSRPEAKSQMAAIMASENKEALDLETKDADLTKMYEMMWVPSGVTTFADLDAYMESQEMAQEMRHATDHFGSIASNIMMSELVEDKAGALSALAKEFAERVGKPDKMKENDSEDGPSTGSGDADEPKEDYQKALKELSFSDWLNSYYELSDKGLIKI